MEVILNGNKITSVDELHNELARQLEIPYYGRNLDALYDILSEQTECKIEIYEPELLHQHLGNYYLKLMKVINEVT